MRARLTPARRAASAFPPMAYTYRPNLVRPRRIVHAAHTPSTISTIHGMPLIGTSAPRSVLQIITSTTAATATPTIFRTVTPRGGATSRRRRASCIHIIPYRATMAPITIQPAAGVRSPLAKSLITLSLMGRVPPLPRMRSITPWNARSPASVTTNDGSPRRVMMVPMNAPISAQTSSAAMHAAHHDQLPCSLVTSSAAMIPPTPPTKPAERSISPSRRTKTRPMADDRDVRPRPGRAGSRCLAGGEERLAVEAR